jgi:8-oxo-dGTP pyrophosphatase MutT (NUDIX family)
LHQANEGDAAFAVILSRAPRVLLVQKADGRWGLPGGRISPGETPLDAVLREVREETGLRAGWAESVGSLPRNGDQTRAFVFVIPKRKTCGELLGKTGEILQQRWVRPERARELLTNGNALRLELAMPFALRLVRQPSDEEA